MASVGPGTIVVVAAGAGSASSVDGPAAFVIARSCSCAEAATTAVRCSISFADSAVLLPSGVLSLSNQVKQLLLHVVLVTSWLAFVRLQDAREVLDAQCL
jgi:ApbE superfamily uncharacterized protein (UPF0280 family)